MMANGPWQCRLVEDPAPPGNRQIGDMWFLQPEVAVAYEKAGRLSEQYLREHKATRLPLAVNLPGGSTFVIDGVPTSGGEPTGTAGWHVSGTAPNITVSPSINLVGRYHGWLHDGVISPDCEGRTFGGEPDA